jgi:hypothetical protein
MDSLVNFVILSIIFPAMSGIFLEKTMSKAEIFSGICGFNTTVFAQMDGDLVNLQIESECKAINKLAQELIQVDPFREFSFRRGMPETLEMGVKHCSHAACPVPVGIIKAVEIEANLALPQDVTIKLTKSD